MSLLTKYFLFGVLSMATVYAFASVTPEGGSKHDKCDHPKDNPEIHLVEVILDKRNPNAMPAVKPKAIVACSQDTIEFERQAGSARQEFFIEFDVANPYMANLKSDKQGVAKGKVMVDPATQPSNPTKRPIFLKYWVKVKGRPDLDPRIIITPR